MKYYEYSAKDPQRAVERTKYFRERLQRQKAVEDAPSSVRVNGGWDGRSLKNGKLRGMDEHG